VTSSAEPRDLFRKRCAGFRRLIASKARGALDTIGFAGDIDALLVAIHMDGDSGVVCWTEPEVEPARTAALQDAVRQADLIHDTRPDREVAHGEPTFRERVNREIRDEARSQAITDALAATNAGHDRTFVTGSRSIQADGTDIHMVVHVDSAALQAVPILSSVRNNRIPFLPSLVHAVIHEVFARSRSIFHSHDSVIESHPDELIRIAASRFVRYVFRLAGHNFGTTHGTLNAVSALPYEGRPGSGKIIIGSADSGYINVAINLRDKVPFGNKEALRKLLEASGPEGHLLSDGEYVYGFGTVSASYPVESESIFAANIVQRGRWELHHADTALLAMRDGVATLPSGPLDIQYFREIVDRLLPSASISSLVKFAQAAGSHSHGAMLIVSSDAAGEAERLHPQASRVNPAVVSPGVLVQLTAMDGGIIIDPQGFCHAIGVILDGATCGSESSARGSRFNNAIRYVNSEAPDAVVIVYSADGNIDILPKLPYRIKRSVVDAVVKDHLDLATPPSDTDAVARSWEAVKRLRFYLSDEQRNRINGAKKSIEDWKRDRGMAYLVEEDLTPSATMDDSYWLPEEQP
jgi:hypothetical protein